MSITIESLTKGKTFKRKPPRKIGRSVSIGENKANGKKSYLDFTTDTTGVYGKRVLIYDTITIKPPAADVMMFIIEIKEHAPTVNNTLWDLTITMQAQARPYNYTRMKSKEVAQKLAEKIIANLIEESEFYFSPANRDSGDVQSQS